MEIHIGQMIKEELERQWRSVVWLANEIHRSRQNCHNIFNNPDINTYLLIKICEVLDHNFFSDISEVLDKKSVK